MRILDNSKHKAAILGLMVGDALGVPAEFKSRSTLKAHPIKDMIGYGTHNQPAGTWSDDSSMTLATLEWLGEMGDKEANYDLLMDKFSDWLLHGAYTPYGQTFDCGIATSRAVMNYARGMAALECGGKSERDNGNGSLMRILPAALWCKEELEPEFIYKLSSLTHAHLRSKMACYMYANLIVEILNSNEEEKKELVEHALMTCKKHFESAMDDATAHEMDIYARLWDVDAFAVLKENEIRSSGYVVDTLEAAIWCFLQTDNYKDCVLKAVNLGEDTDTVGAVAGGLAGAFYGLDAIPEDWIKVLPKLEWICSL